jgi:hypothetical protein
MSLASLSSDPELQKFVAAKELENQLTAQVIKNLIEFSN